MEKYIKTINVPMVCLLAFTIKLIIVGGNVADSIAILGICALFAVKSYLDIKNSTLLDKANEQIAKIAEEFALIEREIASIKLKHNAEGITRKLNNAQRQPKEQKRLF